MVVSKATLALFTLLVASHSATSTEAVLSTPPKDGTTSATTRASAIAAVAKQISNGPRSIAIGGHNYPFYYGPQATPGSLTAKIQGEEITKLLGIHNTYPDFIAGLAVNKSAFFTSMDSFIEFYDEASDSIGRPLSTDISDEAFGLQRHTIKSHALHQARASDLNGTPLSLTGKQITKICGVKAASNIFVENFSDVGKYNDREHPEKYTPNVVGFFCANPHTNQLLPIEIRLLDSKLTYTPLDSEDNWTLAKMALEAASVQYHQMAHMAETHAVTIPLRVEMLRAMGEDHPVRALLFRHVYADFGLENLAAVILLNTSTALDMTFGWGATGSARFLEDYTQRGVSMRDKAFPNDVRQRGLHNFPSHKFVGIGSKYWDAIKNFVGDFLDVYYKSDHEVVRDHELQSWTKASARIPHIRDFPTGFKSKRKLQELLAHLIFTSSIKHHAMNGAATWHSLSAPYSHGALWKPLPTSKDQPLNLIEYVLPVKLFPALLKLAATFDRPVPKSENMFSAYKATPFASEVRLKGAIGAFEKALAGIEKSIEKNESGAAWPFLTLLPSKLPFYTWV